MSIPTSSPTGKASTPTRGLSKTMSRDFSLPALLLVLVTLGAPNVTACGQEPRPKVEWRSTRVVEFETELDTKNWELIGGAWEFNTDQSPAVLRISKKASDHRPPHRSPGHLALLKTPEVSSFRLDITARSTHEPYGHRDVCFYFGYQGPGQFYYVHLAQQTDDHAHQIFIVNQADRVKISRHDSPGVDWGKEFHQVRIERLVETGAIDVYFDDMNKPLFSANDPTFGKGRIGIGSFDDTAEFSRLELWEPIKK